MSNVESQSARSGRTSLGLVALVTLAVLGTALFLRFSRELLIPIVLGALLAYALNPVVRWLEARRLPRPVGAGLLLALLCGLLGLGGYAVRDDVERAATQLPSALQRARERLDRVLPQLGGSVATSGSSGASTPGQPPASPQDSERQQGSAEQPGGSGGGLGQVTQLPSSAMGYVLQGTAGVLTLLGNLMIVIFLVFFLLTAAPMYYRRVVEIAGPSRENERTTEQVLDDITAQIQRFLLVRLITGVVVGVATWAGLLALGIQGAALWGFLAGVFNSIPYFGPVIVSGGVFLVGTVQQGDVTTGVKAAAMALAITSLEGWILEPPLMGKFEKMSTLAVFIGLLVWSWIWGVWGTLLAVPMLVVVKSVADHVPRLRSVSRLLASD